MHVRKSFQSTLPMRGATMLMVGVHVTSMISIHTPHAGSDHVRKSKKLAIPYFNPHSPCGERRWMPVDFGHVHHDFNPHSPCGERHKWGCIIANGSRISIHTPHAGSDGKTETTEYGKSISIHTPHAGSDWLPVDFGHVYYDFNPHSPCGERR